MVLGGLERCKRLTIRSIGVVLVVFSSTEAAFSTQNVSAPKAVASYQFSCPELSNNMPDGSGFEEATFHRNQYGVSAVVGTKLCHDTFHVAFDRVLGN